MENLDENDKELATIDVSLLGEYLKEKRIEKNYSLEKFSQKTKISVNILKSLESNDFEHLPSAAYIKGFVTSYIKVLGLAPNEAINKMEFTYLNVLGKPFPALNHTKLLVKQSKIQKDSAEDEENDPQNVIEKSESLIENTKSFIPLLIFGVIILFFVGGYKIISTVVENEVSDQRTKDHGPKIESSAALVKLDESQKNKNLEQKTSTESNSTNTSTASSQPASTSTTQPEVQPQAPAFQRNYPVVDFKKVTGPLFSIKMDAQENSDENLFPRKIKDSMNPDIQNVYIKAISGDTWLSYKIENNPIESVIISKGNDLFIQGAEIRIFLGNVNVTKIFYNNYLIDTPTKTGVKSLIFPEESNPKFQLPLFPKANDDILYTSEDYIKRMKLEEEELQKRGN